MKMKVKCANPDCQNYIEIYPSRLKQSKNFYCCKECQIKMQSVPRKQHITVTCDYEGCDKTFEMTLVDYKKSKKHYCCNEHKNLDKVKRVKKTCANCGKEIEIIASRDKEGKNYFCNKECHNNFMKKKIKTTCDYCGKTFELIPSKYNRSQKHYCSVECQRLAGNTNRYDLFEDYAELVIANNIYGEIRVKIDLEDVERCRKLTWGVAHNKRLNSWYIQNVSMIGGTLATIYLHRFIMNCLDGFEVDHVYHDYFDCRKSSLNIVTRGENTENLGLSKYNKSNYRGVCFNKQANKWQAYATKSGKKHHGGYFNTAEEANERAIELRNELMTNNVLDRK
jgi:hypothetical protein